MSKVHKHLDFIVLDLIALEASYLIANLLYPTTAGLSHQLRQATTLLLCQWLIVLIKDPFDRILRRDKWSELKKTGIHVLDIFVLDILIVFLTHDSVWVSRLTLGLTFVLYSIIGYLTRSVWKKIIRRFVVHGSPKNAMIVVCSPEVADKTIQGLTDNLAAYFIKGIFYYHADGIGAKRANKGDHPDGAAYNIPLLGDTEQLPDYVTHNWVDEVTIYLPNDPEATQRLENRLALMGITTHRIMADFADNASQVERLGKYIVVTQKLRNVPPIEIFLKRLMDIAGSILGLMFTGIIYLFVAPQIYKADPGPIFYVSDRVGKNGKVFKMYKFRSMYQNADERKADLMRHNKMQGLMFKMDDDPRIIGSEKKDANGKAKGIGNFIRKTSLDEFPQFLNVLKGDMSLVGTRPPTVDEWQQYSEHHRIRLSMRPGITGMWQVSGRSDITDFEEVVRLDEKYIETWTVCKDIKIILKTVFAVFGRKGAE